MLTFCRFSWKKWFQFTFSKSSRNDWFLKSALPGNVMLYLVGGEFDKKSDSKKNCGRWFNILG